MSVIAHEAHETWKFPRTTGHARRKPAAFARRSIIVFLRKAAVKSGRLLKWVSESYAEARMHRAMIEAEFYLNRYRHASKNDDDLPIIDLPIAGSAPAEQTAPFASPRVAWKRAAGAAVAAVKRVLPVIFVLALFGIALAATIALRLAIWLPLNMH
jgi:hypothetical protein